ncbi:MAG: MgtC/SapB family protein [Mucilaginibacter sp.]
MVSDIEVIVRFLLALLWGAMVGAEREYRGKAAGFRTTIMISMGACLFSMLSIAIGTPGNPDRIASNIVTGIGFLGAGVIFRGENRINGITTAATIWAVAAVGMGIGAGYYFVAGCASILILFILIVLPFMQNFIDQFNQSKTLTVRCLKKAGIREQFEREMKTYQLSVTIMQRIVDGEYLVFTWTLQGSKKNIDKFIEEFANNPHIQNMEI